MRLGTIGKYQKDKRQPDIPIILGEVWYPVCYLVTKLLSASRAVHLAESYIKTPNISGTNWLRFFMLFDLL